MPGDRKSKAPSFKAACNIGQPLVFNSYIIKCRALEVGPLRSSYGVWGIAVSSLSGVWGRAPADNEFGVFSLKIYHLVATVLKIFLRIN